MIHGWFRRMRDIGCDPYWIWVGLAVTPAKWWGGRSSEFAEACREALPLVVHGEGASEGGADLDPGMRIAAAAGAGEDVEEVLAELDGVIVGDRAQGLKAADALQGVRGGRWPPGRGGILGAAREAGIKAREEARQHALGVGEGARAGQAQFRAEAILKGAKEPLDAALRLGRMGADPANPEFLERAPDLGQVALAAELLCQRLGRAGPDVEDAVAIGVERRGEPIAPHELAEEEEIAVGIFLGAKDGCQDAPGRIIEGGEQDELRAPLFEPPMMTAIHLDEEPGLRHAVAPTAMAWGAAGAGTGDPGRAEEAVYGPP